MLLVLFAGLGLALAAIGIHGVLAMPSRLPARQAARTDRATVLREDDTAPRAGRSRSSRPSSPAVRRPPFVARRSSPAVRRPPFVARRSSPAVPRRITPVRSRQ
jgi:hypothetical protein